MAGVVTHDSAPHSMNRLIVSTSAVTLATNAPRRPAVCSAIESAWMCANARTRSEARLRSLARTIRRYVTRAAR